MAEHALALSFVVVAWWSSTAAVMWSAWQPESTRRVVGGVLTVFALFALALTLWASRTPTALGAYASFGAALVLWGWHEMSFLSGRITGPRRQPCPRDARGWRRFRLATDTVIHHELALFGSVVGLVALTASAPNRIALWTFGMLWIFRLSAKLNLFAGVPHVSSELLPPNLRYLISYFRRGPLGPGLVLSLLGTLALTAALGLGAWRAASEYELVSLSLLTGLAFLGVLEHLFLALPLEDARLFRWVAPGIDFAVEDSGGHDG
ncbi:MAG: putative photosynthetic complex assembly protein PuhE [Myxococcota bacterium]